MARAVKRVFDIMVVLAIIAVLVNIVGSVVSEVSARGPSSEEKTDVVIPDAITMHPAFTL